MSLHADLNCELVDLRSVDPRPDCLNADCEVGYPLGQALASEIRAHGHNGIVYPSVRHAGGTCSAVFWPGLIQAFQKGAVYTLTWRGEAEPQVTEN